MKIFDRKVLSVILSAAAIIAYQAVSAGAYGDTAGAYGDMAGAGYFNTVSLGSSHSAAITAGGSLYIWGDNYHGQLGNGDNIRVNIPIKATALPGAGNNAPGASIPLNAAPSAQKVYKDGAAVELSAYNIDGNNFFKLRDIMRLFDIEVTYDAATKEIGLDTGKAESVKAWESGSLEFKIVDDIWGFEDDIWDTTFTLTNVSDKPVHNVNADFIREITEDVNVFDIEYVIIYYPSELTVIIPLSGGEPIYEEAEEFLPVFMNDDKDYINDQKMLKPGDYLYGAYSLVD